MMYEVYTQQNKSDVLSLNCYEHVAFLFQKIKECVVRAFECSQSQDFKSCFQFLQKSTDLLSDLGEILSREQPETDSQSLVLLPNGARLSVGGVWKNYFISLMLDIFKLFPKFKLPLYQKILNSLDFMIDQWSKQTLLH